MNRGEIKRIATALGLSGGDNCPSGMQWFDDPRTFAKLRCMANVMIYIEDEFGIENSEQRERIAAFLQDLHAVFSDRVSAGERLEKIALPPAAVKERVDEIGDRIPAEVFVEGIRSQLKKG